MLPLCGAKDKHFSFSQKSCQRGLIQRTGWLEFSRDDHLNPEFSVLQGMVEFSPFYSYSRLQNSIESLFSQYFFAKILWISLLVSRID